MKFTKRQFKEKYNINKAKSKVNKDTSKLKDNKAEEVDESLYGLKLGNTPISLLQIYTDTQVLPGDTSSDFETDIPITTNKYATNAKNKGADMARGGNMGVRWGVNNENITELDEASRDKMKGMVQELLNQKTKENDIVTSDQYNDTNGNNQPDLREVKDINLVNKTEEFLKVLANAKKEDVEIVLHHLKTNIKVNF
jgi:hypothetical protein